RHFVRCTTNRKTPSDSPRSTIRCPDCFSNASRSVTEPGSVASSSIEPPGATVLIALASFMTGIGQSRPRQSSIVRAGDEAGAGPTAVGRATGELDLAHALMPPGALYQRWIPRRLSALVTVPERRPPPQSPALRRW